MGASSSINTWLITVYRDLAAKHYASQGRSYCVREGLVMERVPWIVGRLVPAGSCSKCAELRHINKCMRKGTTMARSLEIIEGSIPEAIDTQCGGVQRSHQYM